MMQHGIAVDLTPSTLGRFSKMYVNEEHIPFECDEEKLYLHIEKLNEEDMEKLEKFDLNSNVPDKALEMPSAWRKKKIKSESGILISVWKKRFTMLPDEVVEKTLENSTHFYLSIKTENRQDPRQHFCYRFPGLRLPRQHKTVASDTLFLPVQPKHG
eukprot:3259076-Ditylum_brightwellii.AAC.2